MSVVSVFEGLFALVLAALASLALARRTGLNAGLFPLGLLAGAGVWLTLWGMAGLLRPGGWALYALALAGGQAALLKGRREEKLPARLRRNAAELGREAKKAPALVLFFFTGAALWLWFAVSRPVFLRWDEFSFWGTACKMTKVNHCLHPTAPGNLSARAYLPGMMVLSYLFQFFSAGFTEWECLAAYDLLALAVFAAFGAFEGRKWYLSALGMLGAGLLPYFFLAPGDTQAATVYLNAMGDVYLGLTFGGALCLYYRAGTRKAGLVLTALALAFLTLIKDMGFAYALIAAALICADRLFARQKPTLPALGRTVGLGAALCVPVLALFLGWNRYVLTAAGIDKSAGVGAAGSQVSYFGMLTDGALQFVGRGDPARAEKFGQVKAAMMAAFTGAPLCLLGGAAAALVLCLAVLVFAAVCGKGPGRARAVWLAVGGSACFAAFWLFHLLLYVYSFSDKEAALLKDYDRYISPYFLGWLLAGLCLLALEAERGERHRLAAGAAGVGVIGLAALVGLRGLPAAGFWHVNPTDAAVRQDVAQRAALVNPYLNWDDQVLLISQGDDATRWYYYGYELNAQLAYGFGGFGYEEGANNWVSTFMSLVTPKHDPWNEEFYGFQKEYPYTAECSQDDLVNFLRQKGYGYVLLDQSDKYIYYELGSLFDGPIPIDRADAAYLFRVADDGTTMTFEPVGEVQYVPQND